MKKTKKGFTLVELVIVVAVMAVLVAVAIPTVSSITKTAKKSVIKSNAQTIESMIKLEEAELTNKEDGTSTALTETAIEDALNAAKLGIDSGVYYYIPDKGQCKPEITDETGEGAENYSGTAGDYKITFTGGVADVTTVGSGT